MTDLILNQPTAIAQGFMANQQQTMSSREIAELTGKEHKNVRRDIEKMLIELSEDVLSFERIYLDSMNREQAEYRLDRELTETLLTGYSARLRRKVIARWRELESGVRAVAEKPEKLVGELALMECFTRMLRPAPSSQIAMLTHIAKNNGLDSTFLPAYAIDAAPDATGGTSMPTKSLTELLAAHGIGYSAKAYNQLLKDAGFIEERSRRSNSKDAVNGMRRFWAVSVKGLQYGKNITNPSSPRETQPHWYEERFTELHAVISHRLKGGAE